MKNMTSATYFSTKYMPAKSGNQLSWTGLGAFWEGFGSWWLLISISTFHSSGQRTCIIFIVTFEELHTRSSNDQKFFSRLFKLEYTQNWQLFFYVNNIAQIVSRHNKNLATKIPDKDTPAKPDCNCQKSNLPCIMGGKCVPGCVVCQGAVTRKDTYWKNRPRADSLKTS